MAKRRAEKRPARVDRLTATAHHEAGHAVAAYIAKRRFKHVSIEAIDDDLGHVLYEAWSKDFRPDSEVGFREQRRIEGAVFTAYAGHAAEAIFTGRESWSGSSTDRDNAFQLASYATGSEEERDAYLKLMWIRARQRLRKPSNWRAVEALANALLRDRRVGYRRAREIIREAIRGEWRMFVESMP